jgi:hypothetical protein
MPIWLQHLLALAVVAVAALVVLRQALATLRGWKGGFGSCCAKGCPEPAQKTVSQSGPAGPVQFIPVESLYRPRR